MPVFKSQHFSLTLPQTSVRNHARSICLHVIFHFILSHYWHISFSPCCGCCSSSCKHFIFESFQIYRKVVHMCRSVFIQSLAFSVNLSSLIFFTLQILAASASMIVRSVVQCLKTRDVCFAHFHSYLTRRVTSVPITPWPPRSRSLALFSVIVTSRRFSLPFESMGHLSGL